MPSLEQKNSTFQSGKQYRSEYDPSHDPHGPPPKANHEKLKRANDIFKRVWMMNRVRDIYARRWAQYEKVWKMTEERRDGDDEWRSSLPDVLTYATIKTAQSMFVDSKIIPTIIRHSDDPSSKADDLRDLYVDVAEKGNLDYELYLVRLDALKLGNGYGKTIYVKDTRDIWDIEKFDPNGNDGKGEYKWKKRTITEFDDPKTVRVSPYLMIIDDLARANWSTVRDLCEVEVLGRDEAEARYGHLVDGDFAQIPQTRQLLKQLKASATTQVAETDKTGLRGTEFEALQSYHFFAPGFDWSDDVVEILHYWNKGITTPSGAHDSYEILINGFPALVDTRKKPAPNPYIHKQLPYFHIPFSPYSGDEHYAAGIAEIGFAEQKAKRKHREQMEDRQSLALFSPAFSDVNDELDQRQLKLKPLTIIKTKGGVPHQWKIEGISAQDLQLQDRHDAAFKMATGINENVFGLFRGRLTAIQVSFLREESMRRLREFGFLYKNALLHREIKLKFSLFKQYFSNPLVKETKIKHDKGTRILKAQFKKFKVKTDNTYVEKEVNPNFFEGEVDIDLDLQILLPLTPAEMATMWSQVLRDAVPFVQAGVVDVSLKKIFEKYFEAVTNESTDNVREDQDHDAASMAQGEHNLYRDPNTSASMDTIVPNGTQPPFLTAEHILKHEELLDVELEIGDTERKRLLMHIKKDIENFKKLQTTQGQPNMNALTPEAVSKFGGGVGGTEGGMTPTAAGGGAGPGEQHGKPLPNSPSPNMPMSQMTSLPTNSVPQ